MEQLRAFADAVTAALPITVPGWVWPVLLVALVMLALLRFYSARVAWRVIAQFLLTIALPLGLILGGALYAVAQVVTVETPIWQAIIAATIIATGWLTTAVFAQVGKSRDRAERLRDVHRALYAEIRTHLANLQSDDVLSEYGRQMVEIMQANPGFVPLVPREQPSKVFDTLIPDIQVLPRETIDPVVEYYAQREAVAAMVEDLRSPEVKTLAQERRINMYRDYIEMKRQTLRTGLEALALINAYARGSKRAARRAARKMGSAGSSSRGADRSGR
ncbi:hypothetical protein [Pseudaestuariivita sp.]|uniref:hypothetical protein n=1 Tax=Pseudaestuariivita sp. TaxID=2211669 RepID=UPI004057F64F